LDHPQPESHFAPTKRTLPLPQKTSQSPQTNQDLFCGCALLSAYCECTALLTLYAATKTLVRRRTRACFVFFLPVSVADLQIKTLTPFAPRSNPHFDSNNARSSL
jgi:hypothetical protein